jgi:hypothetical protein
MSSPIPWIQPQGNQDVDYTFQDSQAAPTTALVATQFSLAGSKEVERVESFCQFDLLEKYGALYLDEFSFFQRPRTWRLKLYDHLGQAKEFNYMIHGSLIAPIEKGDYPIHWLTEVPLIKVFNALELGEALTSMYLRINDIRFDDKTEKDLSDIDLLEDPLVRCLFEGVFGAYQKAQLKRLL